MPMITRQQLLCSLLVRCQQLQSELQTFAQLEGPLTVHKERLQWCAKRIERVSMALRHCAEEDTTEFDDLHSRATPIQAPDEEGT